MIITQQFQPQPACSMFWFVFATTACLFPLTTQCWQSFHPDSIHQNQPLLPKAAAKDLAPHLVLSWGVFICQGRNRNWKCFNDEDVKRCLSHRKRRPYLYKLSPKGQFFAGSILLQAQWSKNILRWKLTSCLKVRLEDVFPSEIQ